MPQKSKEEKFLKNSKSPILRKKALMKNGIKRKSLKLSSNNIGKRKSKNCKNSIRNKDYLEIKMPFNSGSKPIVKI